MIPFASLYPLKSMTAYGRGSTSCRYGRVSIEIQSLNRRYLEMHLNWPQIFMRYEMQVRELIAQKVGRGAVTLSLHWQKEIPYQDAIEPNLPLARGMQRAWQEIQKELQTQEPISLALFAQVQNLFRTQTEIEDEGIYGQAIQSACEEALRALVEMKEKEGARLAQDIVTRLAHIQRGIASIAERTEGSSDRYRAKLTARLEQLREGDFDEDRIAREIAIYAEKVDITEEIVRFTGHLEQFLYILEKPVEQPVETRGKHLDFLLQELSRESNTIGAKSVDREITTRVVEIKSELEKIKEQVQNIE